MLLFNHYFPIIFIGYKNRPLYVCSRLVAEDFHDEFRLAKVNTLSTSDAYANGDKILNKIDDINPFSAGISISCRRQNLTSTDDTALK